MKVLYVTLENNFHKIILDGIKYRQEGKIITFRHQGFYHIYDLRNTCTFDKKVAKARLKAFRDLEITRIQDKYKFIKHNLEL